MPSITLGMVMATLFISNAYYYHINISIPDFTDDLFREIKLLAQCHSAHKWQSLPV